MSLAAAESVARAVLYEGYLLYPYYTSSTKNQHRFQFGGLYPRSYVDSHPGADRARVVTEFLVRGAPEATLGGSLRGLQLRGDAEGGTGDDAEERTIELPATPLGTLVREGADAFGIFGGRATIRARIAAWELAEGLYRVRAEAVNETICPFPERSQVLGSSLLSTHFLFAVKGGAFVSQIDPPESVYAHASANRQEGLFPVLVGEEGKADLLLASPIILYDFPKIAPESRGDLFDGLEIDEILSLRIRTLTDAEKEAVRASGPRAAALLERTEKLSDEELLGLHGAKRPVSTAFRAGDRVRLRPKPVNAADIFDVALEGKTAVVESVEQTFEDDTMVAVTLDEDPGRDLGRIGMPGHRFFFRPDEVEPLSA